MKSERKTSMKFPARLIGCVLLLALAAPTLLPTRAAAQTPPNETISTEFNVTMPSGVAIVGTLVAQRQCGTPTKTTLTFNGMVNGVPAHAVAQAVETWTSDHQATVTITAITEWSAPVGRPRLQTFSLQQVGTGLITVNGVPLAINIPLRAPCTGPVVYSISNAGHGLGNIMALPNTGGGPLTVDPLLIVALLIGPGLALGLFSGRLAQWGHKLTAGPRVS
jgi:hypothetical protein